MSEKIVRGIPLPKVLANIILARASLDLDRLAGSVLGQHGMLIAASANLIDALASEDTEQAAEAFALWKFELKQARAALEVKP
jgi:hypothetical protein